MFWHGLLCVCLLVCLSVPRRIPILMHGPGFKLGQWSGMPSSCALLGGFAILVHGFSCYDSTLVRKLIALYTANAYKAEREISASTW